MSEQERETMLNQAGFYSERQIAGLLNIDIRTLRNRHSARKNCPPRTPERNYPIKEFNDWNRKRLQFQLNKAS